MGIATHASSSRYPVMPDFTRRTAEFAHTVDSAIHVLDGLRIAESRITLVMAGPGQRPLQIVRQTPEPGTPLALSVTLTLWISGFGFFDSLPMPMRESGGEVEIGTREFCRLFDDPLQKAAHSFRAGHRLFDIGPDKHAACRRWIALFGIDTHGWPEDLLYPLALLTPTLARVAGREIGVRLLFLAVLGLPIHDFRYRDSWRRLASHQQSRFGTHASRLGCDFVAGDRQADVASVTLRLGPVPLDIYLSFQNERATQLLHRSAELCMSAYQDYSIAWIVEDLHQPPHLGIAAQNSRIGLNFHLGKGARA